MSGPRWVDLAREAIERVHRNLPENLPLADRVKAVDAAYPFGARSYWPYRAWCKVRRGYLCRFGYLPRGRKPDPGFFDDWPRDPATGRPVIP